MAYETKIYSTHSALVPVVNNMRVQTSRMDIEHAARRFVIVEDPETDENEYRVSGFSGANPTLFLLAGLTYMFDIQTVHPIVITEFANDENFVIDGMTYYNDRIPVKMSGMEANDGKTDGLIYWTIPPEVSAEFKYQNMEDPSMYGVIKVKSLYNVTPMEPLP
jgi:hypothetical protein